MIPDFDDNGNLPPGRHDAHLSEILRRYKGHSPKRKYLTKRLRDFLVRYGDLAVGIWINGSYVTRKLTPGDVDILVLLPAGLDLADARVAEFFELVDEQRRLKDAGHKHDLDIWPFWKGVEVRKALNVLGNWQTDFDRNQVRKGIIYTEMNDDQE